MKSLFPPDPREQARRVIGVTARAWGLAPAPVGPDAATAGLPALAFAFAF